MRDRVWTEAVVVGASLVAVSAVIMPIARRVDPNQKVPIPVWVFAAGALTHLVWEALGGNRRFAVDYPRTLPAGARGDFLAEQSQSILSSFK